jgi:hypothetical protein
MSRLLSIAIFAGVYCRNQHGLLRPGQATPGLINGQSNVQESPKVDNEVSSVHSTRPQKLPSIRLDHRHEKRICEEKFGTNPLSLVIESPFHIRCLGVIKSVKSASISAPISDWDLGHFKTESSLLLCTRTKTSPHSRFSKNSKV